MAGGGDGSSILVHNDDLVYQGGDKKIKNISAIIGIVASGIRFTWKDWFSGFMYATLGNGIFYDKKNTLLNHQIWTLKSFLITP